MTEHHDILIETVRDFARDYNALEDTITLQLGRRQVRVPPTSIRVCPKGDHLIVAHRWQQLCDHCRQGIKAGAVGLAHHFTDNPSPRCIDGAHCWQHFCGEAMPPTEHVVDLDDDQAQVMLKDHVDAAERQARKEDSHVEVLVDEAINDLAEWFVKKALVELHDQVADEQQQAAEGIRQRLLGKLRSKLDRVEQGYSVEDLDLAHPLDPGVHYEDGGFDAWDIDPRGGHGGPIVVTPSDLDRDGNSS
jgi:hypothetical protein